MSGDLFEQMSALRRESQLEARGRQTNQKGNKVKKKYRKLAKDLGIDLSGGATTAASRQSDAELWDMIRRASTVQTRQNHSTVLAGFDNRVNAAKARLSSAEDDYEAERARTELRDAQRARLMAKMVLKANRIANRQERPGRFGPNSADIFGGTSLTLPEDRAVGGI